MEPLINPRIKAQWNEYFTLKVKNDRNYYYKNLYSIYNINTKSPEFLYEANNYGKIYRVPKLFEQTSIKILKNLHRDICNPDYDYFRINYEYFTSNRYFFILSCALKMEAIVPFNTTFYYENTPKL